MLQYPDRIVFSGGPLEFKSLALRYDDVSVNHWLIMHSFLATELDLSEKKVTKYYKEYWKLKGLTSST